MSPQLEGDLTAAVAGVPESARQRRQVHAAGGTITLSARARGDQVAISVRDTGIGIATEVQPRVFELFTRVHPGDGIKIERPRHRAVTRAQAGGAAWRPHRGAQRRQRRRAASSSSPYPRAPGLQPRASEQPAHTVTDIRQRVLVVDDNRDAAESLGMLLEMDQCTFLWPTMASQALEALDTFKPAIALLDIGMPVMDGYEVARRIRATHRGREVVLVALTGWGQADDKKRAADAGFDEHLTKPVDPEMLARVITLTRSAAA